MADRTSKFILARDIRLDKSYKNVLNYTEQQMVTLCTNKAVATGTNLSFIRETDKERKEMAELTNAILDEILEEEKQ